MQGLEQHDLEKMNESTLKLLYDSCNKEIEKLDIEISEKRITIEKLGDVKSYINKVIYHKQSKQDDNSTVQRKKVTV